MASRILFISQDSLNISNKVEITANAVSHQTISENRNQYDTANRKTERNNQSKQHGAFAISLSC